MFPMTQSQPHEHVMVTILAEMNQPFFRNLNSKIKSKIFDSLRNRQRFQDKNWRKKLLASGTSFPWHRYKKKGFCINFFSHKVDLVFCNNVPGVMKNFSIDYILEDWRLFIDFSKTSFKQYFYTMATFASVTVGYSVHLKERYENLDLVFEKLRYSDHKGTIWKIFYCCLVNRVFEKWMIKWNEIIKNENTANLCHWWGGWRFLGNEFRSK